jgi:hypothetical protein
MKELKENQKTKVIKLFLTSYTYDQIAKETGIAKGSVVNIVDDFRDGKLPIPAVMAEYVDELRHLIVDMKKHDANVPKLKSCLKVYLKLQEMGAAPEEAAEWLDVCQIIASPSASSSQLVKAAIELVKLELASGQNYTESVKNCKILEAHLKELEDTAIKHESKIAKLNAEFEKTKKERSEELTAIKEAIVKAQNSFLKQKGDLKAKLDEYIAKVNCSWNKVKIAQAIFESNAGKSGLGKGDIESLSHNILEAGSLFLHNKELKTRNTDLEKQVMNQSAQLEKIKAESDKVAELDKGLAASALAKWQEGNALDSKIKNERSEIAKLRQITSQHMDMLNVAYTIMGSLLSPKLLSNNDIEELTRLVIYVRQHRLGIDPKTLKEVNGDAICECRVPTLYFESRKSDTDIEDISKKLALCLVPLVKDEFVPKWQWETEQLARMVVELRDLSSEVRSLKN